jgi:hypothetical protein
MIANRAREWFQLSIIFILVPVIFFFVVVLRSQKTMKGYKARQTAAEEQIKALAMVQPLTAEERELIADPKAAWRTRIPYLPDDAARLWHYYRTVTELQRTWKAVGIITASIRSSFDPVQGSFTLPAGLGELSNGPEPDAGQGRTQAWVLEAAVSGSTDELYRAMEVLPRVNPLLEPVGLRWQASPEGTRKYLVLRNLVLVP